MYHLATLIWVGSVCEMEEKFLRLNEKDRMRACHTKSTLFKRVFTSGLPDGIFSNY
jgi:hypothetical protein